MFTPPPLPSRHSRDANADQLLPALIIPSRTVTALLGGAILGDIRSAPTTTRGPVGLVDMESGMVVARALLEGCHGPIQAADVPQIGDRTVFSVDELGHLVAARSVWLWHLTHARQLPAPVPSQRRPATLAWASVPAAAIEPSRHRIELDVVVHAAA